MKNARFYYSVPLSVVKALVVGTQDFTLDDVVGFYKIFNSAYASNYYL